LKAMKELKKGGKGKKRKEVQRSTYMNWIKENSDL
jgi:hypothetical protein